MPSLSRRGSRILLVSKQISTHFLARICGLVALCFLQATSACTTKGTGSTFGMQPEHAGFIPARIAILDCRAWPESARFSNLGLSNVPKPQISDFCNQLDAYVIQGFTGQPYMRGYSPKTVARKLLKNGKGSLLANATTHWQHLGSDCNQCENSVSFYRESIGQRPQWRLWLKELSANLNHADAALMPFILSANERKRNDRGLLVAERFAEVALLLVDTTSGDLLWAGRRQSIIANKQFENEGSLESLTYPDWSQAMSRLLVKPLWRDFPGRQVF